MVVDKPPSARAIRLVERVAGTLRADDFEVVPIHLPELEPGQFVVRNTWLSVDASTVLRVAGGDDYLAPIGAGSLLDGWAVGVVTRSRSATHPVGARVLHHQGWRDHAVLDDGAAGWGAPELLPDAGPDDPDEAYLGVLGPTGLTAWAGLLHVAQLREDDVVLVSAAAGAVGSLVVQLAARRGHRVVASVGSPEKATFVQHLGADVALDYRAAPIGPQLAAAVPDGIDVYFDNVGGDHLEAALDALRPGGRVALCGAVSGYGRPAGEGPRNLFHATTKGLTLRGFLARMFADERDRCRAEMRASAADGLTLRTWVVDGLAETPGALVDLMAGRNTGKVLVRLGR